MIDTMKNNWTIEEEQIIKNNHGKLTIPQIWKLLLNKQHYSYSGIRRKVQTMGLFRNKTSNPLPLKNTYNLEYWKDLNLTKCMLAGIIASDGCILMSKNNNKSFNYEISIKDEQLIDLFLLEMGAHLSMKKYIIKSSPHYPDRKSTNVAIRLHCFNKNAYYLEKYFNITPKKTFRLGPTNLDNLEYNLAYIIGLIIGDGTISIKQSGKYKYPYITLSSCSLKILEWVKSIFDTNFPYYHNNKQELANIIKQKKDNCYKYTVSGLRALIILDAFLKIPVFKLKRKFDHPIISNMLGEQKLCHPHIFKTNKY